MEKRVHTTGREPQTDEEQRTGEHCLLAGRAMGQALQGMLQEPKGKGQEGSGTKV